MMQGPGHSKVQFCMAALLASLVLDDEAMEIVRQRGEGHLIFEATLQLVSLRLAPCPDLVCIVLRNG
jgi:hypothetical protein